jgi:hypothetical protein
MNSNSWVTPHIDNILWLSKVAGPYPASREDIEQAAVDWLFSNATLDFLNLFSPTEIFMSREDFVKRCEELEKTLRTKSRQSITPDLIQTQA